MTDTNFQNAATEEQLPEIPVHRFRLENGLTLLVHENPSRENISVHITYGVGAKDEPAGMFGFAHLLEHLMFSGSANLPGSFIQHLQQAGAQGLNGVTNADMTRFFQTVPAGSLDFTLFAESDRMGHLLEGLSPQALDVQRQVVIREMNENELQPYGGVQGVLLRHFYPAEHPYAHKVAGEQPDLQNTAFRHVTEWIKKYYRPDNAVITLSGNIKATEALEKTIRWFGDIPGGEPLERSLCHIPERVHPRRVSLQDNVDATLLRICWPLPPYADNDTAAMEIFAGILANLESSLLIQRLMVEDMLASDISAFIEPGILCSVFNLRIMLQPGVDTEQVREIILSTLDEVLNTEIDPQLLLQSRQLLSSETAGTLSDPLLLVAELGKHELMAGSHQALHTRINTALRTPADILSQTAQKWLNKGMLWLSVDPFSADRRPQPQAEKRLPPPIILPPLQTLIPAASFTLTNGLEVRHLPATDPQQAAVSLLLPAGSCFDSVGEKGLAQLVCSLLATGTRQYGMDELHSLFQQYGIVFDADIQTETSVIHLFMPAESLPQALALLAEMVSNDSTSTEIIDAHKDYFRQVISEPALSLWGLPAITYPPAHPLCQPGFSRGIPADLQAITPEAVQRFREQHYRPQGAVLLLQSALHPEESAVLTENIFADWTGHSAQKTVTETLPLLQQGAVIIEDQPGARISSLCVYFPLPARGSAHDAAVQIIHSLLAGSFGSRINYSLREVHQLTYNVVALQEELPDCRFTGFELDVATSDTLQTISVIISELRALLAEKPVTAEEVQRLADTEYYQLNPSSSANENALFLHEFLAKSALPEGYFTHLSLQLADTDCTEVMELIHQYLDPSQARWLLRGALADSTAELAQLTALPVRLLPADIHTLYG